MDKLYTYYSIAFTFILSVIWGNCMAQNTRNCEFFALDAPKAQANSFFAGGTVSVSERFAIVGAQENSSGILPGHAYIYEYTGGIWVYRQTLSDTATLPRDGYGNAVYIDDNTALVAAYNYNRTGTHSGAVYIYTRQGSQWVKTGLILNPSKYIFSFGWSLAKSGTDVIIGGNYSGTQSQLVAVYRQPKNPTGAWTQVATLSPKPGSPGYDFGYSVDIQGDNLIVGAVDAFSLGQSAAYFYHRSTAGEWKLEQVAIYPNGSRAGFSVALFGNYATVGSDSNLGTRIYERTNAGWQLRQTLFNPDSPAGRYGFSVAMNNKLLLVGNPASGSGTVYRYERHGSSWKLQRRYAPPQPKALDGFGTWVEVDATSNNLIISAPGRISQGIEDAGQAFVLWNPTIAPAGPFCEDDVSQTLRASVAGGTWSGMGITDSKTGLFDPAKAGVGLHPISFSLTEGGCTFTDTTYVQVYQRLRIARLPQLALTCARDTTFFLTATVSGGVWHGEGILDDKTGKFSSSAAGPGKHLITYTLPTQSACNSQDTLSIIIGSVETRILPSPTNICRLDTILQFSAMPNGGTWSGNGIIDAIKGIFSASIAGIGNHMISYKVGNNSCQATASVAIRVNPIMKPVLNQQGVITLRCGESSTKLSVQAEYTTGQKLDWQFTPSLTDSWQSLPINNGQETYLATQPGWYRVRLKQENCFTISEATQLSIEPLQTISVPNIFTPNQDGINDVFSLPLQYPRTFRLQIFDRWGREIFQTKTYGDFWNGNGSPEGVYYYLWRYSTECSPNEKVLKGHITISR